MIICKVVNRQTCAPAPGARAGRAFSRAATAPAHIIIVIIIIINLYYY